VLRGLRETTVASYRTMIDLHVDHDLAATALANVTPTMLNALYARLLREGRRNRGHDRQHGLSARTVRYVHTILNRALADAVRLGSIPLNPASAANPPSPRSTRAPVFTVWSPAELAQFLRSAEKDPLYIAFYVAAATGLRRGEVLGLRWVDVDLKRSELRVVQAVVEVDHQVRISIPKTDRSRRLVALDSKTRDLLSEFRVAAESSRPVEPASLLFSVNGDPIHPAQFSYRFQRLVYRADVPRIRLHDLRHTHATHALQAGVHPKVISERLGHSTIAVTLDTYSHVLPSMQREAAEAVAALLHD
jgi:integrase